MARIRKVKISSNNPEKRVGAAFALIGFIGLYAFLLSVWAGNEPNLVALAAILLLVVGGLGMHRRQRTSGPRRADAPGLAAVLKLPRPGRKRRASADSDEEDDEEEYDEPKKKGLAALFRRG